MIETFGLDKEPTEEQREFIKETNEILNRIGMTIGLGKSGDMDFLTIFYEPEEVRKKMCRNGGRKRKPAMKQVTIAEVKLMNETMGYEKIAKEIGISVSTLKKRVYTAKSDDEFV